MVNLELTQQEAGELVQILEADLSSLRFEIGDTDNAEFRQALKGHEELMKDLLSRLQADRRPVVAPSQRR